MHASRLLLISSVVLCLWAGCTDIAVVDEPDLAQFDDAGAPTSCGPFELLACDDADPCTTDDCMPGAGCRHVAAPDGTPCHDADACNGDEHCHQGLCLSDEPMVCYDGIDCTEDSCLPASGCVFTARDSRCDDGNLCTDELCDATLGCRYTDNSVMCSDGSACTINDACASGACIGGPAAAGCSSCQAAAMLPPGGGVYLGQTSGTGTLSSTCDVGAAAPERVYQWTPTQSGTALIETCGSSFDTVLSVRAGLCPSGAQVKCENDTVGCAPGEHEGSRVFLPVTAGQLYFIVVDGSQGASGNYRLTVVPANTCGNQVREGSEACDGRDRAACPSRRCDSTCHCLPPVAGTPDLIADVAKITLQLNTTVPNGDVVEGCAGATAGVDLLRFDMTTRNIGTADLMLGDPMCPQCSTNPLALCGNPLFHCSPAGGHNHGHYQNYATYELFDATNQLVGMGHKQGFCLWDSDCALPLFTCVDQGLTVGCGDLYAASLGCQYVDVTGVAAGDYLLRVTIDPLAQIAELSETNNVTERMVTIIRP